MTTAWGQCVTNALEPLACCQSIAPFKRSQSLQVENPIPFSDSAATRALSLGYLHARYASLLLAPVQLSADWSYACIPLVDSLQDPRNLLTAALYAWLLWTALATRPWRIALELWQRLTGVARREGAREPGCWAQTQPNALLRTRHVVMVVQSVILCTVGKGQAQIVR